MSSGYMDTKMQEQYDHQDIFVWPSDQDRAESDELNRVCEYLEQLWDEHEELKAHQQALVGALTNAHTALQVADFTTGTCCCGDNMEGHSYTSGHAPVDEGDDYQRRLLEDCQNALEQVPAVSLAEVKARAIWEAIVNISVTYNLNELNDLSSEKVFDLALDKYDQALLKYTDHLRKDAQ